VYAWGKIVCCRDFTYYEDDADLATVMGHEVSNTLANHGAQKNECCSITRIVGVGVAVATSGQNKKHNKHGIKHRYWKEVGVMLPF
jgi:predicted Zn-dependent protease